MSTAQPRLTPNKTNENCNPEHLNFALSSHKIDKVSIDRFGGVHRDQQIIYQNYAPLVRVDVAVQHIITRNNSGEYQLQELREVTEKVEKAINQQKQQSRNNQLKRQKIQELLVQLEDRKRKKEQLRQLSIKLNEVNQQMRRQKLQQMNQINDLTMEVDSKIVIQARDELLTNRQIKLNEEEIKKVQNDRVYPLEQLQIMEGQIDNLQNLIAADNQIAQGKLATISDLSKDVRKISAQVNTAALQLSVLKMQINPKLRVGFSTISLDPEGDRLKILDKQSNVWSRNKIKSMTNNQIRDYLIMQLYPHWKKMLNKMSSDFIGYQQLLCYQQLQEEHKILDLSLYLPQTQNIQHQGSKHLPLGKGKSYMVLYSPITERYLETIKVATDLVGSNNGIIHIREVTIQGLQNGNEEITIEYDFEGTPKIKKIEVILLQQLTKDIVMKCLPMKEDKNVLMKIEIPLIPSSFSAKSQYEQVYDLLRRWK